MIPESQIDLLTRLFQSHYGFVVSAARRYAPGDELVDDVVQSTYLDFVAGSLEEKWDLELNVGSLLYQIAKRKGQMLWRERIRKKQYSADYPLDRILQIAEETDRHESEAKRNHDVRLLALAQCMEKLPPKGRTLVERHYFDGVTIKEISRDLRHQDADSLYHFFCRVRKKLRECIEQAIKSGQYDE